MQVVFTVNGPGETMGWLHPLATTLRQEHPNLRIYVCILPCVFSTGAEKGVIEGLEGIDGVLGVPESLALIFRGRLPEGMTFEGGSLVFHLGGEVALSHLLGLRLGAPRYGYFENPPGLRFMFRKAFYSGLSRNSNSTPDGNVGELMVDAANMRRSNIERAPHHAPCVALLPGSRAFLAVHLLPYIAVIVDRIAQRRPGIDWVLARSRFLSLETLQTLPPPLKERRWEAVTLSFGADDSGCWLATERGNRIRILDGADAYSIADYALTIPGTNTGELATHGVPMVVALPTYMGDQIPLPGLPGHLSRLPIFGRALKIALGWQRVRRLGLLALPNVRAGEMLVPEFIGEGLQDALEDALDTLLAGFGQDGDLRERLRNAMGGAGAARRLAAEIGDFFTHEDATHSIGAPQ
jgi:lipid-A-disaccharide synthase